MEDDIYSFAEDDISVYSPRLVCGESVVRLSKTGGLGICSGVGGSLEKRDAAVKLDSPVIGDIKYSMQWLQSFF